MTPLPSSPSDSPAPHCSFTDVAGTRCLLTQNHSGGHESDITRSGPLRPWHNGFYGEMAWDAEAGLWFGEIQDIAPDVATFEGPTANDAAKAFRDTVRDYLVMRRRFTKPATPELSLDEIATLLDGFDDRFCIIGNVTCAQFKSLCALARRAQEAERDSQRLDWLETQIRDDATETFGTYDQSDNLWHMRDGSVRDSLREAIDAAREVSP